MQKSTYAFWDQFLSQLKFRQIRLADLKNTKHLIFFAYDWFFMICFKQISISAFSDTFQDKILFYVFLML